MNKDDLEASLRMLDILLIVFGLFVAVGVTGESVFGFMHWRKSNQLRRIQSAENLAQEREIVCADAQRGILCGAHQVERCAPAALFASGGQEHGRGL